MAQLIKIGIPKDQWNKNRTKSWYSDFRIGKHRIKHALSKFKPEAERLLKEMLEVRKAQKRGDIVQNMSWSGFRETFLKERRIQMDIGTYNHDRRSFELVDTTTHLTSITQMTPDRLARIQVALMESGKYTESVIVRALSGMITAMRWAEDRKYVDIQNWRPIQKNLTQPQGRKDFYRRDDYLDLLSKLSGDWFTSALLMGRAGLRLGEALHLEWEDIKFIDDRAVRIVFRSKPHLISKINPKGWRIKKDKKLKKVRIIPVLFGDLRQHLEALRKPSGFVLGPEVSRREDTYSKQLAAALEATGTKTDLRELGHPHILRHTFGSHLAQIGVPPKKIAEWMGHESVSMTEGYTHLCPAEDTIRDISMFQKLCSGFDPVSSSGKAPGVLFGTLGPEITGVSLSTETIHNT